MAKEDPILKLGKEKLLAMIEEKIRDDSNFFGLFPIKEFNRISLLKNEKSKEYLVTFKNSVVIIIDSIDKPTSVHFWFTPLIKHDSIIDINIRQSATSYTGSLPRQETRFVKIEKEIQVLHNATSLLKEEKKWEGFNEDKNWELDPDGQMIIIENKDDYIIKIMFPQYISCFEINKKTKKISKEWGEHIVPFTNDGLKEIHFN
jgi:hypothetical protein